uniref:Uncharacterized protein n=1 Tax=Glossina brevipalpis TaxID=37001 RepID=A0A1A9W2M7_9MUSC
MIVDTSYGMCVNVQLLQTKTCFHIVVLCSSIPSSETKNVLLAACCLLSCLLCFALLCFALLESLYGWFTTYIDVDRGLRSISTYTCDNLKSNSKEMGILLRNSNLIYVKAERKVSGSEYKKLFQQFVLEISKFSDFHDNSCLKSPGFPLFPTVNDSDVGFSQFSDNTCKPSFRILTFTTFYASGPENPIIATLLSTLSNLGDEAWNRSWFINSCEVLTSSINNDKRRLENETTKTEKKAKEKEKEEAKASVKLQQHAVTTLKRQH